MRPRLIAGALGMAIAVGFYAAIPAAPAPRPAVPMSAVDMNVRPASVRIVDPTPIRLVIASIGVNALIESRGLDANRNLATPSDFHDVAWYKLGPKPGEAGNALINGHVNWWTGDAVFTRLHSVKVGDEVRVIRGDGQSVLFKITGKQTVDAHSRIASLFAPSSTATLTLITCSGVWNPLTQSDTERLLVSASLE